jgi:hypothetical protein
MHGLGDMPRVPPGKIGNEPDAESDHARERRDEFLKKRFPKGIPPEGGQTVPLKTDEPVVDKNGNSTEK